MCGARERLPPSCHRPVFFCLKPFWGLCEKKQAHEHISFACNCTFPWRSHSAQEIFGNSTGCCCRQAHQLQLVYTRGSSHLLKASWHRSNCYRDWRMSLRQASAELRKDWTAVMNAVSKQGMELRYADSELKKDWQIVMAAVSNMGRALIYAHPDLRREYPIVKLPFPTVTSWERTVNLSWMQCPGALTLSAMRTTT